MSGEKIYCFCRQGEGGRFMIGCDGCQEWFHGDCVNVPQKKSKAFKDWFCPVCRSKKLWSNKLNEDIHLLWTNLFKEKQGLIKKHLSGVLVNTSTHHDSCVSGNCDEWQAKYSLLQKDIEILKANLLSEEHKCVTSQGKCNAWQAKLSEASAEVDCLKTKIISHERENNALQMEMEKLKADLCIKKQECDSWQAKFSETFAEVDSLKDKIISHESANSALKMEMEKLKANLSVKKQECDSWQAKFSEASAEGDCLKNKIISALQKEIETLKANLSSEQSKYSGSCREGDCVTTEINSLEGPPNKKVRPRFIKLSLSQHKKLEQ